MNNIAAANDRASDKAWDAYNDLHEEAERLYDRDAWLPQDMDDADNLIRGMESYLGGSFWLTLADLKHGDDVKRQAAIKALTDASRRAIHDRCLDMAGDV